MWSQEEASCACPPLLQTKPPGLLPLGRSSLRFCSAVFDTAHAFLPQQLGAPGLWGELCQVLENRQLPEQLVAPPASPFSPPPTHGPNALPKEGGAALPLCRSGVFLAQLEPVCCSVPDNAGKLHGLLLRWLSREASWEVGWGFLGRGVSPKQR